jgi:hypothetical protein
MTFLEYVCHELLGFPASGSCWFCPWCAERYPDSNWASLNVRPPLQRPDGTWYAIKFRCHRPQCGKWGDEFDLIKHVYRIPYSLALAERTELWTAYRRDYRPVVPVQIPASTSPLGDRSSPPPSSNGEPTQSSDGADPIAQRGKTGRLPEHLPGTLPNERQP